jgi:tetratricopeptide (TPR) repeat protein
MSRPTTGARNIFEDPAVRAAWHLDRAQRLLTEGGNSAPELEKAIRELNVASSLVPNLYDIQIMFAAAFRRAYDYSSAIFSLRMALHLHPHSHEAKRELCEIHMVLGKEFLSTRRLEEAKANFDQAIKYNPRSVELWVLQAVCCMFLGHLQHALECVTKAIEISGQGNIDLFILRAQLYWKMGLTTAGDMEMRIAERINPEHPEVKKFIGRSFEVASSAYDHAVSEVEKGNLEGAIKPLEQAITLSPNDVKLHLLLAKIFRVLRRYQDSYIALQCAGNIFKERDEVQGVKPPEQSSADVSPRDFHSEGDGNEDDNSDAGANLEQESVSVGSGEVAAEKSGGRVEVEIRSSVDAKTPAFGHRLESMGSHFEDDHNSVSQRRMPAMISTQLNLLFNDMAMDYATKGELEKATRLLTKVILSEQERMSRPGNTAPMDYRYFMNRGDLFRLREDHPAAIADYASALQIDPGAADVKAKLAIIMYEDGVNYFNNAQYDACIKVISDCINLSVSVCEYYVLRGRAKYYTHDFEGAHDDFLRAKDLDPSNPYPNSYLAQFENRSENGPGSAAAIQVGPTKPTRAPGHDRKRGHGKKHIPIERPEVRDTTSNDNDRGLAVSVFQALASTTEAVVGNAGGGARVPPGRQEVAQLVPAPRLPMEVATSLIVASKVSRQLFLDTLAESTDLGAASKEATALIDTAGRVAAAALRGPEQIKQEKELKKKKKTIDEKPSTLVALKRMSDDITKQRLKQVHSGDMTLVKGIVSSRNDPELVSLRQLQAMRRSRSSMELGDNNKRKT